MCEDLLGLGVGNHVVCQYRSSTNEVPNEHGTWLDLHREQSTNCPDGGPARQRKGLRRQSDAVLRLFGRSTCSLRESAETEHHGRGQHASCDGRRYMNRPLAARRGV
jgi:hypothetical protein